MLCRLQLAHHHPESPLPDRHFGLAALGVAQVSAALFTESAFGKELRAVKGKQSGIRVTGAKDRLC